MIRLPAVVASLLCLCPVADAGSALQVLDYGAEPRTPLRYRFAVGQSESVTTEMAMNMAREEGGKKIEMGNMPPVRSTMTMRVTEVAPDGSARLEFETRTAEANVGLAGGKADQARLNNTLAGLSQLSGWYRMDTRGRTLQSGFKLPGMDASPQAKQMMDEMLADMDDGVQPLPDEAVGVGARWRVVMRQDLMGIKVAQAQEFTLRSRTANRIELDIKLVEPPADPSGAPAAPGMPVLSAPTGTGKMVLDLHRLMPTMSMDINSSTTISPPQSASPMTMTMQMRISAAPATE